MDTSELSVEAAVEEAGSQFKKDLPENLDILQDAFSYKALNLYQDCDTKYAEDEKHYPYLHAIKIKGAPLQKEEGSVWGLFKETLRGGVFGNNLNHHFPGIPMPTREFIMLLASREYLTGALRALTPAISNQIEMIKPGIEGRVSTSLHVQEILIDGDPTNFHFTIQYQIAYWPKFLYQNKQVAIFRKNPPLLTCKLDVQTQRPVGEKIQFPAQVEIAMEMGELKATPEPVKKSADLDEDLQDSQTKQESPDRQESYYDINFYPL
ncbi:hypothetical protein [Parendozoicomonas haliclonae]|uniref:hypothetical protein n=1 Tax=Parendozoicomonas haliclonae TaxID=1960125 RepID=UPI0013FD6606|nr:hypothetical protein [Parendozoicomonas haliclonae]